MYSKIIISTINVLAKGFKMIIESYNGPPSDQGSTTTTTHRRVRDPFSFPAVSSGLPTHGLLFSTKPLPVCFPRRAPLSRFSSPLSRFSSPLSRLSFLLFRLSSRLARLFCYHPSAHLSAHPSAHPFPLACCLPVAWRREMIRGESA